MKSARPPPQVRDTEMEMTEGLQQNLYFYLKKDFYTASCQYSVGTVYFLFSVAGRQVLPGSRLNKTWDTDCRKVRSAARRDPENANL